MGNSKLKLRLTLLFVLKIKSSKNLEKLLCLRTPANFISLLLTTEKVFEIDAGHPSMFHMIFSFSLVCVPLTVICETAFM